MSRRKMPSELRAKFFEGVEDTTEDKREWEVNMQPRPARLGLGADPKSKPKVNQNKIDRRITNMVNKQKHEDSSDSSDDDNARSNFGNK